MFLWLFDSQNLTLSKFDTFEIWYFRNSILLTYQVRKLRNHQHHIHHCHWMHLVMINSFMWTHVSNEPSCLVIVKQRFQPRFKSWNQVTVREWKENSFVSDLLEQHVWNCSQKLSLDWFERMWKKYTSNFAELRQGKKVSFLNLFKLWILSYYVYIIYHILYIILLYDWYFLTPFSLIRSHRTLQVLQTWKSSNPSRCRGSDDYVCGFCCKQCHRWSTSSLPMLCISHFLRGHQVARGWTLCQHYWKGYEWIHSGYYQNSCHRCRWSR